MVHLQDGLRNTSKCSLDTGEWKRRFHLETGLLNVSKCTYSSLIPAMDWVLSLLFSTKMESTLNDQRWLICS